MITRRVPRALLSCCIVALPCVVGASTAHAQDQSQVVLRLVAQTAWTTPKASVLSVTVEARNDGPAAIGDLSFGITIGQPIRSRNLYDATLTDGPGDFPVFGDTPAKKGDLLPGEPRLFSYDLDVSSVGGVSATESAVYPLQVDLRSDGVPVAAIHSAAIHLVQRPEQPLRIAWWAEITAPPVFDPDGRLADPSFEASIAEGGQRASQVEALLRIADDPDREAAFDLVLQPSTLEQLVRMRHGYERTDGSTVGPADAGARDADRIITRLEDLVRAPGVEVSAMPFSAPLLPSLLTPAIASDLSTQFVLGRRTLIQMLGSPPVRGVLRPPLGALDDPVVAALAGYGVRTILVNADTVARLEQPNEFAPLPTSGVTGAGNEDLTLVLPDPSVSRLLSDPVGRGDPILTAQVALGELAMIWREAPVPAPPTVRGVAVALPSDLPAGLWGPLTRRLADAPFLHPVIASELGREVYPVGAPADLTEGTSTTFPRSYADAIRDARRKVEGYDSMLGGGTAVPDRLQRNLLMAESGTYLLQDVRAGARWIDQVDAVTGALFEKASPDTSQVFTLTSRDGTIPIRMGDPGDTPITVELQFRSSRFTFPDGDRQIVELKRPNQIVNLRVVATGAGPGTIEVVTRAPNNLPLHQQQLVVRVTAVNRIALIITGASALLLAGLWARRMVRRRT